MSKLIAVRRAFGWSDAGVEDLFLVSMLYALSTAGISRADLSRYVVSEPELYRRYSKIFSKIYNLAKGWGYDIYTSIQLVLPKLKGYPKNLLTRLSQAIISGAELDSFLKAEALSLLSGYDARVNRKIDATRILFTLYSTFMSVSVFILANLVLMAMLTGGGDQLIVLGTIALSISVAALGAVVIAISPRDAVSHKGSRQYSLIEIRSMLGLIIGVLSYLVVSSFEGITSILSVAALSIPMIILGRMAISIENMIMAMDENFASFLRSLGHILKVSPNLIQSLETLTNSVLGPMTRHVDRMIRRLRLDVGFEKAWKMMIKEIGSRVCMYAGTAFIHTYINMGRISEVGEMLANAIDAVNRGRMREIQMARSYEATAIMLHVLVSSILGFIVPLTYILSSFISSLGGTIFSIVPISMSVIEYMNMFLILTISVVNGIVVRSTFPGTLYASTYHIGLFIILGWSSYYASTIASDIIIKSFLGDLAKEIPGIS